uniref:NADAR domain-containing protein n=1 Tax=Oxyrrhis marina TaxID=2969 RepID=A0A7S4GQD9_OXYMA|mmetsp:Transcript_62480/g.167306  ORF Transcript_62480/g.167306 Transcript_62480/m.167306 type:complete len:415 (-) Transcript_62480:152-1396(-)
MSRFPRHETAAALMQRWSSASQTTEVLPFYRAKGPWSAFSNFHIHTPFEFEVPEWCRPDGFPTTARLQFAEAAIMLCKAALMQDRATFDALLCCETPADAKQLGRCVEKFDSDLWDAAVCSVAAAVVEQKFRKVPGLREVLVDSGSKLLAEATRNDRIWGIGIDVDDARVKQPAEWRGSNILGWALMEARTTLSEEAAHTGSAPKRPRCAMEPPLRPARWPSPMELRERWQKISGEQTVVEFYSHSRGHYRAFSNFYETGMAFEMPSELRRYPWVVDCLACGFSEKAIMLCKAAVFGDENTYKKIVASKTPTQAKKLGRAVTNFDQDQWDAVLCMIAFEVVRQKFCSNDDLKKLLLSTGTALIAEATVNDAIWGIGLNCGDPRVREPQQWCGKNVLGWALMTVRDHLAGSQMSA